jgi:hypothetical protein
LLAPPTYVRVVGFQGRADSVQMFAFVAPGVVRELVGPDGTAGIHEVSGAPLFWTQSPAPFAAGRSYITIQANSGSRGTKPSRFAKG